MDVRGEGEMSVKGNPKDFRSFMERDRRIVYGDGRGEFGLTVVGGKEGDRGFVRSYGKAIGGCPGGDRGEVGIEREFGFRNGGGGVVGGEVVCIGGGR